MSLRSNLAIAQFSVYFAAFLLFVGAFGLGALVFTHGGGPPTKPTLVPMEGTLCTSVSSSSGKVYFFSPPISQLFFCLRSGDDSFAVTIPNPVREKSPTQPFNASRLQAGHAVTVWVSPSTTSGSASPQYPFSRLRAYGLQHRGVVLISVDEAWKIWSVNYWRQVKIYATLFVGGITLLVFCHRRSFLSVGGASSARFNSAPPAPSTPPPSLHSPLTTIPPIAGRGGEI
jgi:hypothetical protein